MRQLNDSQLKAWIREHKASGNPLTGKTDGDGLTFVITKAGAKKGFGLWGLRYRHGARQSWLPIGRYPDLSLMQARKRAQRERVRVGDGVDVAMERRRAAIALRTAQTFGELAEEYVAHVAASRSESTQNSLRMYLDNDILPTLGKFNLDKVSATEIVTIVDRVGKRTQSVARFCFRFMNAIFDRGIAKLACKHNPCVGLKLSAILGVPRPTRSRVNLTQNDLRAVLEELPRLGLRNALALKVILATCVRKGELVRARWDHIDLEASIWSVPPGLSKTAVRASTFRSRRLSLAVHGVEGACGR